MRRRFGIIESMMIVIAAFAMVVILIGVAITNVQGAGDLVRAETVNIMSERVTSSSYALAALDDTKLEMDLGRSNYRLYSQGGEDYLEYTYSLRESRSPIEELSTVNIVVDGNPEDDERNAEDDDLPTDTLCLETGTGDTVTVMPGRC